jgi:SAM-dependent methyltransferase
MTSVIDLGSGAKRDPRATDALDFYPYPGVTVVHDLTKFPWPIADSSFDEAVCHQVIEHLPHREAAAGEDLLFQFFNEVWRILKPGGTFSFDVPEYRSSHAHNDLTHRRFFGERAFNFLWIPERDSQYPRRVWQLVNLHVDREYGWGVFDTWHVRKYAPWLDRVANRVGFGNPHFIFVVVRKPS